MRLLIKSLNLKSLISFLCRETSLTLICGAFIPIWGHQKSYKYRSQINKNYNCSEWSGWRQCSAMWSRKPSTMSFMIRITERWKLDKSRFFPNFDKFTTKNYNMANISDLGQTHVGVKGAGDVEPKQWPILLCHPLSSTRQKQRLCTAGIFLEFSDTFWNIVVLFYIFHWFFAPWQNLTLFTSSLFVAIWSSFDVQRSWLQTGSESYIINHRWNWKPYEIKC